MNPQNGVIILTAAKVWLFHHVVTMCGSSPLNPGPTSSKTLMQQNTTNKNLGKLSNSNPARPSPSAEIGKLVTKRKRGREREREGGRGKEGERERETHKPLFQHQQSTEQEKQIRRGSRSDRTFTFLLTAQRRYALTLKYALPP